MIGSGLLLRGQPRYAICSSGHTGISSNYQLSFRLGHFMKAGSNDWQMFLTVALPSSVPMLLAGLRLGLGHALVGIVVGEMYGATHGLGFLIATSGARFQTDKVMVGIILIASAGVAMTELLRRIE